MGRPRIKGALVSEWLAERQRATAREVAYGLQLSIPDATLQLHRLEQAGLVARVDQVRVEHAKRPVAVYGPVERDSEPVLLNDDWLRRA